MFYALKRAAGALSCYGPSPSSHCIGAICRNLSRVKDKKHALHLFNYLQRIGLETHRSLRNDLVLLLVGSGNNYDAENGFTEPVFRDTQSFNMLIAGYVRSGKPERAFTLYQQLIKDGSVKPSVDTLVALLSACAKLKDPIRGMEIHYMLKDRETELFVGSTLVDMYAKCGMISQAQNVFDKLEMRNVVSWTALIAGYVENRYDQVAMTWFEQMQREGVLPNAVTFVCCLKACANMNDIVKGQELHAEIERQGLISDNVYVGGALVDMYSRCGFLMKAKYVFSQMPVRNVVVWNSLITGYSEQGHWDKAIDCFDEMRFSGVVPDAITFTCILRACCSVGAIDKGQEIHGHIDKDGFLGRDTYLGNALVSMYAKGGLLSKAQEVFDSLKVRDVVSWTALIDGYAEHGHGEDALKWLEEMQSKGMSPNEVTYICGLKACGNIGARCTGEEIHAEIERRGLQHKILIGGTLVDMYAKCGSLVKAQQVFEKLAVRNAVSWTALMAGYLQVGNIEHVFHNFDKMLGEGIKPTLVTFVVILNACTHKGLITETETYFETMSKQYGIVPVVEHHTCVVDLLGRSGHLVEAISVINKVPVSPDLGLWNSFLSACKSSGNVEFGKRAFEHAIKLYDKKLYIDPSFKVETIHMQQEYV